MTTYTATLFTPGQAASTLTEAQVATLFTEFAHQDLFTDTLEEGNQCRAVAVWSIQDNPTNDTHNPEAEAAVYGALGELSDLSGRILLVVLLDEATEQAVAERDPYEYNGDEPWPTYHEARNSRNDL